VDCLPPAPAADQDRVAFGEDDLSRCGVLFRLGTEGQKGLLSRGWTQGQIPGDDINGVAAHRHEMAQGEGVAEIHQGVDGGQRLVPESAADHGLHGAPEIVGLDALGFEGGSPGGDAGVDRQGFQLQALPHGGFGVPEQSNQFGGGVAILQVVGDHDPAHVVGETGEDFVRDGIGAVGHGGLPEG